MTPLIAPPLSPSLSHAITLPITRSRRRALRWGYRHGARNAYMVRVNDDGYPVEEPEMADLPRVIRPASSQPGRASTDHGREARIRWHMARVARHE